MIEIRAVEGRIPGKVCDLSPKDDDPGPHFETASCRTIVLDFSGKNLNLKVSREKEG